MPKTLVLFPTQMEFDACWPKLQLAMPADEAIAAVVGFGVVAAGIEATRQISLHGPDRVALLGIAGSLQPANCPGGSAHLFDRMLCDGIGVGSGSKRQSASEMGWSQWPGDEDSAAISDELTLPRSASAANEGGMQPQLTLLTVCSASADAAEASERCRRFPTAVAEDMEGFAVAMAAARADVPLSIVRGISNQAGDRDHSNWKIAAALEAALELALETLAV